MKEQKIRARICDNDTCCARIATKVTAKCDSSLFAVG